MEYTLKYFIKKFEAIPEDKWTTEKFISDDGEQMCVLGHCGSRKGYNTEESIALLKIYYKIAIVNDGIHGFNKIGSNPKKRVLNYLKKIMINELNNNI